MRKSEDVLRKIIGEAVAVELNEAKADDIERIAFILGNPEDKRGRSERIESLSEAEFELYMANSAAIRRRADEIATDLGLTARASVTGRTTLRKPSAETESGFVSGGEYGYTSPEESAAVETDDERREREERASLPPIDQGKLAAGAKGFTLVPPQDAERGVTRSVQLTRLATGRPGGGKGFIATQQPTVGLRIDHFSAALDNLDKNREAYEARQRLVTAMSAASRVAVDPLEVLRQYIVRGSISPRMVSSQAIIDMICTPAVLEKLGVSLARGSLFSVLTSAKPVISVRVATNFAHALANQLTAASRRKSVTEAELVEGAQKVLSSTRGGGAALTSEGSSEAADEVEVNKVIADITDALTGNRDAASTIQVLSTRISTHAETLRPFMQQISTDSSIRRLVGGRAGIVIPSTYVQGAKAPEISPSEQAVFDQAAAAKFKHWQAEAVFLIARASYLLDLEEQVLSFYRGEKQPGKEKTKLERDRYGQPVETMPGEVESPEIMPENLQLLISVFGTLDDALTAHPYAARLVGKSKVELSKEMRSIVGKKEVAAEKLGQLRMTDQMEKTLGQIIDKFPEDDNAYIAELLSAYRQGKRISEKDVNGALNYLLDNNLKIFRKVKADLVNDLTGALESALENQSATFFVISRPEGSAETVAPEDESSLAGDAEVEGNVVDNERLREAINIVIDPKVLDDMRKGLGQEVGRQSLYGVVDYSRVASIAAQTRESIDTLIRKALKAKQPIAKLLNEFSKPLAGKLSSVKEEQKETTRVVYDIAIRSEGNGLRSAAIKRALSAAYEAGAAPPNIADMVSDRVETARSIHCESSPGTIFLTPFNAGKGAVQVALEAGLRDVKAAPALDTRSVYAIAWPVSTGAGTREDLDKLARDQTAKKRKEYVEKMLSQVKGWYSAKLEGLPTPGRSVVIPSMMRRQSKNLLVLGQGKVISADPIKVQITPQLAADQGDEVRSNLAVGMEVNVMSVTVSFPASQWRLGVRKFRDRLHESLEEKRINLRNELTKMGREDALSLLNKPRTGLDPKVESLLVQIEEVMKGLVDTAVIQAEAVKSALSSADPTLNAAFLNTSVSLDSKTGTLTIAKIAPAFLDDPMRYRSAIRDNGWESNFQLFETTREEVITLETKSVVGSRNPYVPLSAVQLKVEHIGDPASPFNVNRPTTRGLARAIQYTVGDKTTNVSVTKMGFATVKLAEQHTQMSARARELLPTDEAAPISVEAVAEKGMPQDELNYPIKVTCTFKGDQSVEDRSSYMQNLRGMLESDSQFSDEYVLASTGGSPDGKTSILIYEMREAKRDALNRITAVRGISAPEAAGSLSTAGATSELKVGDMVYISPLYDIGTPRANSTTIPELLGVGKIRQIYFNTSEKGKQPVDFDESNPFEFRALLADIEFRGDQVKTHGQRGSIRSQNFMFPAVGIAFIRRATGADDMSVFSPDRPISDILAENYPDRRKVSITPIFSAGWHLPSPADQASAARPGEAPTGVADSTVTVGGIVKIVDPKHPLTGSKAKLLSFSSAANLTPDQVALIRQGGMSPSSVNAVVSIYGASLMDDISKTISQLAADVKGAPFSSGEIKRLFKHIDREITQMYINNPRLASGFLVHKLPSDSPRKNPLSSLKGAGEWEKAHAAGIAVHSEKVLPSNPSPKATDTLYGCNAIYKAILEYGPEKSVKAEVTHEAERHYFGGDEVTYIPGALKKKSESERDTGALRSTADHGTLYPPGSHTGEARYIKHSLAGLKQNQSTLRAGSPVGTSFRFQLSPEDGLAYTRLLRSSLAATKAKVQAAIDKIDESISSAAGGTSPADERMLESAKRIRNGLEELVLTRLTQAETRVKSVGYHEKSSKIDAFGEKTEEKTSAIVNSLDAWREAQAELSALEPAVEHSVSPEMQRRIKIAIDALAAAHRVASDGTTLTSDVTSLFDSAPIPTGHRVEVDQNGQIKVVFTTPRPVHDKNARDAWRRTQLQAIRDIADVAANSSYVKKQDGTAAQSKNSADIQRMIAKMEQKFSSHEKFAGEGTPLAWEVDILAHPAFGSVVPRDAVQAVILENAKKNNVTPFLQLRGETGESPGVVSRTGANARVFGTVQINRDRDLSSAEDQFFKGIGVFIENVLNPGISKVIKELESAKTVLHESVVDTLVYKLVSYQKVLRDNAGEKWRSSVSTHHFDDKLAPDIAARKSSDLAHLMVSSLNGIFHLGNEGKVVMRMRPQEEKAALRSEELREKMNDISQNFNERDMLSSISGFPNDSGLQEMLAQIDNIFKMSLETATSQVCVPINIATLKKDDINKLLAAKMAQKITFVDLSGCIIPG